MSSNGVQFFDVPEMQEPTLLLALTGWMDGGLVSSGTVKHLMEGRSLAHAARIESAGFYIDNFPGSMEIASLFRPHVKYAGGLVESFDLPSNDFYADAEGKMAFFVGREPNLNWPRFGDAIFDVVSALGVKQIVFMGSFGGTVPHTREPRLYGAVSDAALLPLLVEYDLQPTDYEGPGSFATYLLAESPKHNVRMLSISVEIPGYLEGLNPLSIEAVTRRLAKLLNLPVDMQPLRDASTTWELQVTDAVNNNEELAKTVRQLEEQYDNALIEDEKE